MKSTTYSQKKNESRNETEVSFNFSWKEAADNTDFHEKFTKDVFEPYVVTRRWYGGKVSTIKNTEVIECIKFKSDEHHYLGFHIEVNYEESFFQNYFIVVGFLLKDELIEKESVISEGEFSEGQGFFVDALYFEDFRKLWFELVVGTRMSEDSNLKFYSALDVSKEAYESSRFIGAEQSNTSIIYNDMYVMKFFRRLFIGVNPDYEIAHFLTEKQKFSGVPSFKGGVNMQHFKDGITLALMQQLIPNKGDAWEYFNGLIFQAYQNLERKKINISKLPSVHLFQHVGMQKLPLEFIDFVGLEFFTKVKQLAERTAELHIALGSNYEDTHFTSTNFNGDYAVWLKNRLIYQVQSRLDAVENNIEKLQGEAHDLAEEFLLKKKAIRNFFLDFDWTTLKGERIRIHGDYHLGQVLVTDEDFVIIDFEGEPESTIRDRKIKQPPLKDLAGLFRSYHYALFASILNNRGNLSYQTEHLFEAGEKLFTYIVGLTLSTYFEKIYRYGKLNLGYSKEQEFLLKYHMTEKAVYELGYELNSRPDWAIIPLKGISSIMKQL